MRIKLGAAIYPEHYCFETINDYIVKLKENGVRRIFISLLQIDLNDLKLLEQYKKVIELIHSLDLKVIADINPEIIDRMNWRKDLPKNIFEFGIDILRIDTAIEIQDIIRFTNSKYNLKIEINLSTNKDLLDQLLSNGVNPKDITASHNFYPKRYTGLSLDHFMNMTQYFKSKGIETSAFINAQSANEGPWPLSEGLCTLEMGRNQSIDEQLKFFQATGLIDYIVIANQFISINELNIISETLNDDLTLKYHTNITLSKVEQDIINLSHTYRGDISDYVIRSSEPRIKFKENSILPRKQKYTVEKGDILIDNDNYPRYKGELSIALKKFNIDDRTNVVGHLVPEHHYLLDYIQPWEKFKFQKDN
ncbi:DUF871 domain-containing protein [Dolosigranulum pigrum]|uniref:DUF871 domain-containing protein n=1 Tax=Dolosigranulum pigrum TaxID=29394 RepID=UPI001AD89251|nr:MupG family TIM beta-alpha barrel fold protein [Dolosigranulum pigrum]